MKAYHGKESLKQEVLAELQAHYEADNFIQGFVYWDGRKGCAVGCLLKSGNHIEYEERFGIPVYLAHLEDAIFEGLSLADSKNWPLRFMSAFEVGKDYSGVVWDFLRWLLLDFLLPQIKNEGKIYDDVRTSIKGVADVLGKGTAYAAYAAVDAVDAAADAADTVADAYAAVDAADTVADAYAAVDAARTAAYVAAYAAAAAAAADAAAYAAAAADAYAARTAAYAADARAAAYKIFADKLIELIKEI